MATAAAASAPSSLFAPAAAASTAPAAAHNALLFPSSVPSLRAYPRLLLAFRRPAAAAVADPQGAVLEAEEEVVVDQGGRYDDDDDGYEGGRGPAFTPPTRPRTGKAALPLKRDRTRSKRFLEIQKLRESKKEYDVPTAITLMKQMASAKFKESAEAHFRMNLDPKYNDQQLRATVNLPKGTGQTVKIAAIEEFKQGKVEYRVDKSGIVHIPFGKVDFPEEDLIANFMAVVRSVERNKPSGAKGIYWKTAYLCSSMGPSIKLNIKEMLDYGSESSN
nr:unnamed protein product [Digitaria exilis]